MVVGEIRARIGLCRRDVESMVKYDQRQSIVSKCDTQTLELLFSKVLKVEHSHHLCPQRPISNHNVCELSCMEAMVRMADNEMGSNMYRRVRFPRSAENMDL